MKEKKFKAKYSMGLMDYERISEVIKNCQIAGAQVLLGNSNFTSEYYAWIDRFYINLEPLMKPEESDKINTNLMELWKQINDLSNMQDTGVKAISPDVMFKLRHIERYLMRFKQLKNLGIDLERVESIDTQRRRAQGLPIKEEEDDEGD